MVERIFPHGSTGNAGLEYPELERGMPVDRTICPSCLGLENITRDCPLCHGNPVCPTCRNGRVMSVAASRMPTYRVCPDCCFAEDGHSKTGVPNWSRNPSGQTAAIARYRRLQEAA